MRVCVLVVLSAKLIRSAEHKLSDTDTMFVLLWALTANTYTIIYYRDPMARMFHEMCTHLQSYMFMHDLQCTRTFADVCSVLYNLRFFLQHHRTNNSALNKQARNIASARAKIRSISRSRSLPCSHVCPCSMCVCRPFPLCAKNTNVVGHDIPWTSSWAWAAAGLVRCSLMIIVCDALHASAYPKYYIIYCIICACKRARACASCECVFRLRTLTK